MHISWASPLVAMAEPSWVHTRFEHPWGIHESYQLFSMRGIAHLLGKHLHQTFKSISPYRNKTPSLCWSIEYKKSIPLYAHDLCMTSRNSRKTLGSIVTKVTKRLSMFSFYPALNEELFAVWVSLVVQSIDCTHPYISAAWHEQSVGEYVLNMKLF